MLASGAEENHIRGRQIDGVHRAPRDLDEHIAFLRRVVARGRYTAVVLVLRGGYQYTSHPELARASFVK